METGKPVCARNDYTICQKNQKKKNRSEIEKLAKMSCDTHLLHGARKLDVFTSEMISKAL
jgi:hypothetical protein|tara:strand:- start:1294 stop:1473 length:180 start_codon:yes stop_codon:yes gene_type:complete